MLSQEKLKYYLHYNPETGVWTWINNYFVRFIGERAGRINNNSYRQIQIEGKLYYEHRLAFLYMTGEWPENDSDHKNRIRNDNRWENLRDATRQQNNYNINLNKSNKLGTKGVSQIVKNGKYKAQIRINGEVTIIGVYETEKDAELAYNEKAKEIHGNFYHNPNGE